MGVVAISSNANFLASAALPNAMTVSAALVALADNPKSKVSVTDTSENIARNFDILGRYVNNVRSVTVTDAQANPPGVMTLTAAQVQKQSRLLSKIVGNYGLNVSLSTAAGAAVLESNSHVRAFSVYDNSAELSSHLIDLKEMAKLSSISVSTPATLISLSASQMNALGTTLEDKIRDTSYGLAISAAKVEDALTFKDNTHVRTMSIVDTASNICDSLSALQELGSRLKVLRSSDTTTFDVTADQLQRNAMVIGRIYRGYELAVHGASMSQAATLASNRKVISVDVEDTADRISASFMTLSKLGSDLHSIHITDAVQNSLTISGATYRNYGDLLSKVLSDDAYSVSVTGATVLEAQTLATDDRIASVAVSDTAQSVGTNLDYLATDEKIAEINLIGRPRTLAVSLSQVDSNALAKIQGGYTLAVSGVAAADALNLVNENSAVVSVTVNDSGSEVVDNLPSLSSLGKRIASIALRDGASALNLSVSRWSSNAGTLAKIVGGYGVALTDVSANQAATLAADARVRSIAVKDTAAAIVSQLDVLHSLGAELTSLAQTDQGVALQVTGQQYAAMRTTFAKLGTDYALVVKAASVSQASSLAADDRVGQVSVMDSSTHIASGLDELQAAIAADTSRSWSIQQSGSSKAMSLTSSQYQNDQAALNALIGAYTLHVNGVTTEDLPTVAADSHVTSISVTDEAANLRENLFRLAGLGGRLQKIVQSNPSDWIELTSSQWATYKATLDKVVGGARVSLSGVSASEVRPLSDDMRVRSMVVRDTGAHISAKIADLQNASPLISSIEQIDSSAIVLSMSQLLSNKMVLGKLSADSSLSVHHATADDAQTLLGSDFALVNSIDVTDTSARLASALSQLADNSKIHSIYLSDINNPLRLTMAEWTTSQGVLSKLQGGFRALISGATAADVADLASNSHVTGISVSDSAGHVVDKLNELGAAGSKLQQVSLSGSSTSLSLTYAQWVANQATLDRVVRCSLIVSGVNAASASVVAAASRVNSVRVSDTVSNIAKYLDAMQSIGSTLSAITSTDVDPQPLLSITASQLSDDGSALSKITGGNYRLAVKLASAEQAQALQSNGKVVTIAISDSSANIVNRLAELSANTKLSGTIAQSGEVSTMVLTAAQYQQYSSTIAKIQNPTFSLTEATVSNASSLQGDVRVESFAVKDSTLHIGGSLASLGAMSKLTGLQISQDDGPILVSEAELDNWSGVLGLLSESTGEPYRLQVTRVSIDHANTVSVRADVDSLSVAASSLQVSEGFDDLFAMGQKLSSVVISDLTESVAVSHQQWLSKASLLSKIEGNYQVSVVDLTAAAATAMSNEPHVVGVSVRDSAADISSAWDELAELGSSLLEVQVDDGGAVVISASQAQDPKGEALLGKLMGDHEVVIQD